MHVTAPLPTVSRAMRSPWGLILVAGPTGSGKTTTLYALARLATPEHRVVTSIEDPVEFELPNVRQLEVDLEHGITMEAVRFTSTTTDDNNSWVGQSRSYANSYSSPVVVGQVMSANDADWSVFWASSGSRETPPTSSSLSVGKHVAEDPDTTRANEEIGYIVIEKGTWILPNQTTVTVGMIDALGGDWDEVPTGADSDQPPVVLTQVIGRAIGLVGRGIVQGMGRSVGRG